MKRRKSVLILIISLLLFYIPITPNITQPAQAQFSIKLSTDLITDLLTLNGNTRVSLIILTSNRPSFLLKTLLRTLGGVIDHEFNLLNGLVVTLPLNALATLVLNLEIESISLNRTILPLSDISRATVGGDIAQQSYGLDGSGIGVAVIDSGINGNHEDLINAQGHSRIVYAENFVDSEPTTSDLYGHGTHVAGILAGDGSAVSGDDSYRAMQGIAPNANLINLRVLNSQGSGIESDVIDGIERAISLRSTYNIRVINLSLGAGVTNSYTRDPLCRIVSTAWNNNIVVVVSAGNLGNSEYGPYGLITSPGNSPYVITVGASNARGTGDISDDTMTTYSSRGPTLFDHVVKPDIVAPGNRVKSLAVETSVLYNDRNFFNNRVDPGYYLQHPDGQPIRYFTLSGTSMAAPVVAGAAALLLQRDPTLNNHTIKMRLMATANKLFAQRFDIFTVGAGVLDINAALQSQAVAASSKSPYVQRTADEQIQMIIDGSWKDNPALSMGVVWGGNIIFGNGVVWGGNVVYGNGVVWGGNSPFSDPQSNLFGSQSNIAANGDE